MTFASVANLLRALVSRFDVGRAALSVLIALALFSAVHAEQSPPETGSFDVPIELVNTPPGYLVLSGQNTTVQTRVSAPREQWVSLRPSSFRAVADLSRARAGIEEYPVTVDVPDQRVRVLDVVPPRVSVRLDESLERSVPVRVTRIGNPPFGYEAGDAQVDPPTVTIAGPASVVRRIEAVAAEVRLDGVTVDVDSQFAVTPIDTQGQTSQVEGQSLRITPPVVRVRIPVTQQVSYKTVTVQPVITGSPQEGYAIQGVSTDPATVIVVGPPRELAAVNFASTEPVELGGANTTFTRQVGLALPNAVSPAQQNTVAVTVRIAPLPATPQAPPTAAPTNPAPTAAPTPSTVPVATVEPSAPTEIPEPTVGAAAPTPPPTRTAVLRTAEPVPSSTPSPRPSTPTRIPTLELGGPTVTTTRTPVGTSAPGAGATVPAFASATPADRGQGP